MKNHQESCDRLYNHIEENKEQRLTWAIKLEKIENEMQPQT